MYHYAQYLQGLSDKTGIVNLNKTTRMATSGVICCIDCSKSFKPFLKPTKINANMPYSVHTASGVSYIDICLYSTDTHVCSGMPLLTFIIVQNAVLYPIRWQLASAKTFLTLNLQEFKISGFSYGNKFVHFIEQSTPTRNVETCPPFIHIQLQCNQMHTKSFLTSHYPS